MIIDIIVLSFVILLGLKGIMTGFVKEFFGLVGIIGGVYIASRLGQPVGEFVNHLFHFESAKTVTLIGFVIALAAFWLLAVFLGTMLAGAVALSGLGIFDRILGFVFSGGKIFLIFSVIFYALSSVTFISRMLEKRTASSTLYPALVATGAVIVKLDPAVFKKEVNATETNTSTQER